jgi:NitT/TauT family transport system substrate-binding protein
MALAFGTLLLTGSPPAKAGNLSLTTGLWVGYGPLYLARDLGYFHEAGLEVDLAESNDAMASMSSLVAGRISGMAAEVDFMLPGRKNACFKGVVALDDSSGADGILTGTDVTDLAQLKGKAIAVSEYGWPNVFFGYVLKKGGLTRADVEVINMKPEDAAAAFMAGRVPAAVTYEPSLSFATDNHKGRVLFDSRQTPGLIADLVYLRCDIIDQRPEDVKALVHGLFKADDYILSHPDDAYDIMRKYVGGFLATRDEFAAAARGVTYYGRERNQSFLGTDAAPGDVMETVRLVDELWGPAMPIYTYGELFDPEYIR